MVANTFCNFTYLFCSVSILLIYLPLPLPRRIKSTLKQLNELELQPARRPAFDGDTGKRPVN